MNPVEDSRFLFYLRLRVCRAPESFICRGLRGGGCNNTQCKIRRNHHFHPPGQHDPLVVDGKQQRAVMLGLPQTGSHVAADPFAVRHGRPSHRVEPVDGHDSVERFVARGQRPEREVLGAVRV